MRPSMFSWWTWFSLAVFFLRVARSEDEDGTGERRVLFDFFAEFKPILFGHYDIADDDVGLEVPGNGQGLPGGSGGFELTVESGEKSLVKFQGAVAVVHKEKSGFPPWGIFGHGVRTFHYSDCEQKLSTAS